jgi:carbon-monoxide dehydrogenase large subunit
VVDIEEAITSTTLLYEGAGSNVVFDTTVLGMPDNTGDAFFEGCEVVVKGRFLNQRVAPCPLEVRGSAVAWGDGSACTSGSARRARRAPRTTIAKANGVEPAR